MIIKDLTTINNYYKTILSDPAWKYKNVRTGGSMSSGAAQKYECMSTDDICKMPVKRIAHKDSILFLWVTTPFMHDGLHVMESWGFKYKTAIYWRKIMSLGMGYYFRGQVELCLVGIRGKIKAFRCQKPNFLQTKVRKHSQKPDEIFEWIEPVSQDPKLEMFATTQRDGWDSFGKELK